MAVTETEKISYGSRIGSSLRGVITGVLVFLAAFPLLFWNEGRAVKTARALDEGEGVCQSVDSNMKVDDDYEGSLVHMVGKADTKDIVEDEVFGVKDCAIRLRREVEIFQWVEDSKTTEKKNVGGSVTRTTTYTYKQEWCRNAVDSSGFKEPGHVNPNGGMEFESAKTYASNVSFGAFKLNADQIASIGHEQAYLLPSGFVSRVQNVQIAGDTIYVPNAETRNNPLNNRSVAGMPRPGDYRVKFSVVKPHKISIVAKQRGDSFVKYTAKNGRKISMLSDGERDAAEMFETARTDNTILTWILRLVGLFMMYCGITGILKPLSVVADVLPILGDLVEVGNGIVAGIISFVCAIVTIAIAWIFYRPILGILLLVLAAGGIFLLLKKRNAAKAAKTAAASVPVPTPPAQ